MVTNNIVLKEWISEIEELCKPTNVYWCDGTQEEYDRLCEEMVNAGTFIRLNNDKRKNCLIPGNDQTIFLILHNIVEFQGQSK